jgi:hypothetical protein
LIQIEPPLPLKSKIFDIFSTFGEEERSEYWFFKGD